MANYKQKPRRDLGQIETDTRDRAYRPQSARNINNVSSSLKSSQIIDQTPYKTRDETLGLSSGLFSTLTPSLFKEKFITPKSNRSMKSHTSKHKTSIEIENLLDKKYSMNKLDIDREEISSHLKEIKQELGQTNTITRADQLRDRKIEHIEKQIIKISEDKSAMRNKLNMHMEIYQDFLSWINNKQSYGISSELILSKIKTLASANPIPTEQVRISKLNRSKSFEKNRFKSPYNSLPFQIPTQTRRSMASLIISRSKTPAVEDSGYIKDLWKLLNRCKSILEYKTK